MIPIEPISIQHVATHIRIGVPDYIVGATSLEAVVLFLDERDAVVRVERLDIPVRARTITDSSITTMSDSSITTYVMDKLNIIARHE
jgi:hypothetical protein